MLAPWQIAIKFNSSDGETADTDISIDRALRLLRREHGARADMNIAAPRQLFDDVNSAGQDTGVVYFDELNAASGGGSVVASSRASSALFERTTATRRLACNSESSLIMSILWSVNISGIQDPIFTTKDTKITKVGVEIISIKLRPSSPSRALRGENILCFLAANSNSIRRRLTASAQ